MRLTFACLVCLLPLGVATADAPARAPVVEAAGTSKLVGKVLSADGKPLAGARVIAHHPATGRTTSSEPTSRGGEYVISGLTYGFVDVAVETDAGRFVSDQVVNLPPSGKAAVLLTLLPEASGPTVERFAGSEVETVGIARLRARPRGREFWQSPRGVAILAGTGGAALLAIAGSSDDVENDATPFLP